MPVWPNLPLAARPRTWHGSWKSAPDALPLTVHGEPFAFSFAERRPDPTMTPTQQSELGGKRPSLRKDERGAVLVEFLVALTPLMITFSSFVQLSQMATARVVVKHATIVGARAAAVMSNANHNTPDQKAGDGTGEIREGVKAALGPWSNTMNRVDVTVDDKSTCSDPYDMVTVTVNANYRCSVPFGGRLVCGIRGGTHDIVYKVGFPHQGARFKEGGGAQCQ